MQGKEFNIKKNLLDLDYQRKLQIYNTTLIILFTYLIGVIIALVSEKIDYINTTLFSILLITSAIFVSLCITITIIFQQKMKQIRNQISSL